MPIFSFAATMTQQLQEQKYKNCSYDAGSFKWIMSYESSGFLEDWKILNPFAKDKIFHFIEEFRHTGSMENEYLINKSVRR